MDDEIILVDKPAGISSFGVVSRVRGAMMKVLKGEEIEGEVFGAREEVERIGKEMREGYLKRGETIPRRLKVGHAGTLDPFATGLLILLIGKGTKRSGEFLKLDKEYEAEVRLGATSSTGDPEGEISPVSERIPTREEVERAVKEFVGEIQQKVPAFSAVKINGERAYKLARKGKEVQTPVRKVKVYQIEVLEYEYPRLSIRAEVSSGTYVRTLGEDIGKKLGVGAYLTNLRRTKVGKFSV